MDLLTWLHIIIMIFGMFLIMDLIWKLTHITAYIDQRTGKVKDENGKIIGKVVNGKIEWYDEWHNESNDECDDE